VQGITRLAAIVLATATPIPVLGQSQVLVVDAAGGSGAQFADIPPAVVAAADGDVILVRPGIYSSFDVVGKGLRLIGDVTPSTSVKIISGRSRVRDLPADRDVVVSDMRLSGGLELTDCDGQVLVQGVTFGNLFLGTPMLFAQPALDVRRCGSVVLARSHVGGYQAPSALPFGVMGPIGIHLEDSDLFAWDSTVEGGKGADGQDVAGQQPSMPTEGFAGISIIRSTLVGDELHVSGGPGGDGTNGPLLGCTGGGGGGTALLCSDPAADVDLRASGLLAGPGGQPGASDCWPGPPGDSFSLLGGQLSLHAGEHRNYGIPPVAREGETVPLTIQCGLASAGTVVVWIVSTRGQLSPLGFPAGALLSWSPEVVSILGLANPTGSMLAWQTVPELGGGAQAFQIYSQAVLVSPASGIRLTEVVGTTLLDSAF
jgi:hypothetical protein